MSEFLKTLSFCSAVLVSGCSPLCDEQLKSSYISPSESYMANVVSKDCGATTSEALSIFVARNQGEWSPHEYDQVMLMDKVNGLSLSWKSDKQLFIEYDSARVFEFSNFGPTTVMKLK